MLCGHHKRTGADGHVCKWKKICGCGERKALVRIGKMRKPEENTEVVGPAGHRRDINWPERACGLSESHWN